MDKQALLERNKLIAENGKLTRARRALQECKVFDLKIAVNKLKSSQKEAIDRLFLEAKWYKNTIIACESIQTIITKKQSSVQVKMPDGSFETRELKHLGSHQQQSILAQVKSNLKTLATQKQNGRKVGRLNFVKEVNSIELKQYGNSYRFKSATKVRVQGIPGYVRVRGIKQLEGYELANARLVRKPSGYHLLITAFKNKNEIKEKEFVKGSKIGIDMGVKTHLTLSNGLKHNVLIEETERLKRLQRKLSRQIKGSNNYGKTRGLIRKQYEYMNNQKNDAANKIVSKLLNEYETIYMQDENLKAWVKKNGYVKAGRKLHHSILGRVKTKLVAHDRVVVLNKWVPTTQLCGNASCGVLNKHGLNEREYSCSCGYVFDRDTHAALNMIRLSSVVSNIKKIN